VPNRQNINAFLHVQSVLNIIMRYKGITFSGQKFSAKKKNYRM